MEIKNNLENKSKFFAQYLGQKVLRCNTQNKFTGNGLSGLMYIDINRETLKSNWYLELTPLSDISDEDYRTLVQSEVMNPNHLDDEIDISNGHLSSINLSDVATVDFLRSRGYALPWMGISVEKLVEWGWVKLKGGEND